MNNESMTTGKPYKHIIKFFLPVFFGLLLQQLYNTVDTIVVGRYAGELSLSAVGTTGSFTYLFLALATGFSAGNGVLVSQNYGAENQEGVRKSAATGVLFLIILGIALSIFGILISYPAFKYFLNVPNSFIDKTLIYFNIYSLGLIFQYGYNIIASILRAIGDSVSTLYFLLISSIINIFLDIFFVANLNMGVQGAAIATVISQAISFVASYIYMTKKYVIFRFKLNEYILDKIIVKKTINIGLPISMQLIVVSMGLTFIQRAVNTFGQIMTASFTVGQRIEQYIMLPCNAFQTTLATYTGQNFGAKKIDRIKLGAIQTIIISLFMTLLISLTLLVFAKDIVLFFGLSGISFLYAVEHIKTVAIINIVLAAYIPLFGVFQGTGHSKLPMFVVCVALFVRVSVTYLLRYSNFLGYKIIWWNGIFGFGIGFFISWWFYITEKWKN